ncbi:MAG: heavy-metal-associated domain-containing protein [Candidatus Methylomirabilales bacterium]
MKQIQLHVAGMTCTGCEQRIQRALARLEGVLSSSADWRAGRVHVAFDPARTAEQAIRACIEQAGYGVSP